MPRDRVPYELAGQVIDMRQQVLERIVDGARAAGLEAVELRGRPLETRRLLAVDLAAPAWRLVDDQRPHAMADQRLCCAYAGRARADDDRGGSRGGGCPSAHAASAA